MSSVYPTGVSDRKYPSVVIGYHATPLENVVGCGQIVVGAGLHWCMWVPAGSVDEIG